MSSSSLKNKLSGFATQVQNTSEEVGKKVSETTNALVQGASNVKNTIEQSNAVSSLKNGYGKLGEVGEKIAEKNSFVAKIVFVVFIFILFGLFFRLGVYILTLFYVPQKNPIIIPGMRSTQMKKEYQVNPTKLDPKPILRSINEDQGMEFSWSSWVWINSVDYESTDPRILFTKGMSIDDFKLQEGTSTRKEFIMNSPGLYIYDGSTSKTNSLSVVVSFFDDTNVDSMGKTYDVITIHNIPMQKWVNVIIRVQGRIVDVYINGTLTKRRTYEKVVKQNYGNIHVGSQKNGADAYISSLRYFNYAIGPHIIQDVMYNGPNLKMEGSEMLNTKPPYLAMKWYLDENL